MVSTHSERVIMSLLHPNTRPHAYTDRHTDEIDDINLSLIHMGSVLGAKHGHPISLAGATV